MQGRGEAVKSEVRTEIKIIFGLKLIGLLLHALYATPVSPPLIMNPALRIFVRYVPISARKTWVLYAFLYYTYAPSRWWQHNGTGMSIKWLQRCVAIFSSIL